MDLKILQPFLELVKTSEQESLRKLAGGVIGRIQVPTQHRSNAQAADEEAAAVESESGSTDAANVEGQIIEKGFNDLKDNAPAQKTASAYIKDISFKELPKLAQKEVERFVKCRPDTKLIHYGMVVSELLGRVDPHNFKLAEEHTAKEKIDKEELYKKAKDKYILIVNESIVDGNHMLARCKKAGITCSLNVLDLSPARFQKSAMTTWDVLKQKFSS